MQTITNLIHHTNRQDTPITLQSMNVFRVHPTHVQTTSQSRGNRHHVSIHFNNRIRWNRPNLLPIVTRQTPVLSRLTDYNELPALCNVLNTAR